MDSPSLLKSTLDDLIHALPFSAHVRDVKTDRYLLANRYQAKFNGFEPDGEKIIGLTNLDLQNQWILTTRKFITSRAHQINFRTFFDQLNYKVQHNKKIYSYQEKWVEGGTGYIYFGSCKKIPILGNNQKCIAILTLSEEITDKVSLLDLFYAYKGYYSKKLAIGQFLAYLSIDHFFIENLPTEAQILTLIAMQKHAQAKHIAQFLKISIHTAEIHIRNLRAKLINHDLNTLLGILRHGNKNLF